MRRLLTGGIKAIVAIATLATAVHWVLRVQREPVPPPVVPSHPAAPHLASTDPSDPVTTGSIGPRGTDAAVAAPDGGDVTRGLDQRRLSELFAGAVPGKVKVEKASVRR